MQRPTFLTGFLILCMLGHSLCGKAQAEWTTDPLGKEQKPEKYEDKILASEKTADKKFGTVRRFIQNTTSHYNFYYNANNKLNAIIERAKLSNKDDYSKLLSFYPYSLVNTASQKNDLDSVIYKATAGILLHDLRTEWVDNFYFLIGKAYFLRRDFDSAAMVFQFINYNLYPRKKNDDGYNKVVGSRDEDEEPGGKGSVSIADKEKRNFLQKTFTLPPSRNDALIWQIRTFTEKNEFADAAGLISILQNDRNLPARLKNDLEEVISYWFYAQNNYDSAAVHLAKGLSNADTKDDKSRWAYLVAQMYEQSGKYEKASEYYVKAARQTNDPVMDIYARLNEAKMMRNTQNLKELDNSIANLLRMARRDKYEAYRDIIYYSTGRLSLQRPDTLNSIEYYNKSISYTGATPLFKDKSYLQLGDIAFNQHRYQEAYAFYDSVNFAGNDLGIDTMATAERKEILSRLVPYLAGVQMEDSLQLLAAMDAAERDALLRKMVKKYRKSQGLKEDDNFSGNTLITFADRNNKPVDLFTASASNKGEWYFYNASLRSKGFTEFKNKWGKRENTDNWRRKNAAEGALGKNLNAGFDIDVATPPSGKSTPADSAKAPEYSYETLLAGLPLSPELTEVSNKKIAKNLFEAALIFQNELQDYYQAIATYDDYLKRFPKDEKIADIYYNLAYCYAKIGDESKANFYRNIIKANYAGSNAARVLANPSLLNPGQKNPETTAKYEAIYGLFLEGNFEKALAAKRSADSTNGNNYWTPQLLYIEAVYYIKERKDSNAVEVLKNLRTLYPNSPLQQRATVLIEVLGRRASIEKYLTDLQVTRLEDNKVLTVNENAGVIVSAPRNTVPQIKPINSGTRVMADSIKAPDAYRKNSFTLQPDDPHFVVMILDKVNGVYTDEAKTAFSRFNKGSGNTANITISKDALDGEKALLIFTPFENANAALLYFDKIKKAAPAEVSWLQPSKYSFLIISDKNLQLLKTNKDIVSYKQLLHANFSSRF